ncbi:hypothetical protein PIB30_068632 [Stylosanthes scabra]|uniref:Uncharacterized protein n=1 Tax=Stylosanthes scabra TaxID=79078 RepID=A0ABU6TNP9_9FABA|nr:hypothetical protein [Stylosanthes scabra]
MARTMPIARYCRKPARQPAGPHCYFGSPYVNTVMGIDSLLSKSTFVRKKAQRIDFVAERIDSLGLCYISAELLSSKPSNSFLPRPISTILKHFLNLKTYFENLFSEIIFIVQNQSYGSPKFAQKHVFLLKTSPKTFLGLSPQFNAPRALISKTPPHV